MREKENNNNKNSMLIQEISRISNLNKNDLYSNNWAWVAKVKNTLLFFVVSSKTIKCLDRNKNHAYYYA